MRIGMVGAGAVAARHAAVLTGFDDVELLAVADPDVARAEALATQTGTARPFGTAEAMLDAVAVDAVYVCVPPFAHGEPERACLARRLPFFVEKPLSVDLALAEEIAAEVERLGLLTATGYHWRYLEPLERARALLADNPARLVLGYWLDKMPPPAWWSRRSLSGGQAIEQLTHVLDAARLLAGEVTQVHAVSTPGRDEDSVEEVTAATLRFADGAVGSMAATCVLRHKHRAHLEVYADGLVIEAGETDVVVRGPDGPARHSPRRPAKELVDRAFVDAVAGRDGDIRAPYGEALRTHRLGCALARSARTGRPVDVPA